VQEISPWHSEKYCTIEITMLLVGLVQLLENKEIKTPFLSKKNIWHRICEKKTLWYSCR